MKRFLFINLLLLGCSFANKTIAQCTPPTITGTTPATRCGTGTVTLSATPSAGTINWYTAATGGSPVGTGNTFTTPALTTTTTYYAAAATAGGGSMSYNIGLLTPERNYITQSVGWGAMFTVSANCTLDSLTVFPTGTGTINIKVLDVSNTVLYTGPTVSISGTGLTSPVVVPVLASLTPGNYKLGMSSTGITNLGAQQIGTIAYPFSCPPLSITGGSQGTGSSAVVYYWFYNWRISTGTGCESTRQAVVATINPKPDTTVTVTGNLTLCQGVGSLSLSVPAATGVSYQWLLNNNVIAGATTNTYAPTASGNYRVRVANTLCFDTSNVRVVVINPKPTSSITPPSATSFCTGKSVTLNGPAPATGVTAQWLLNNSIIAGATSNTYTATTAGSYRLLLSNGTCSDTSAAVVLTTNPSPTATVTPAGVPAFCTGGSVVLNANTGTGFTYIWQRSNTTITGANTATYMAATAGIYRVIVTSGTCTDTSATVTVYELTKPVATIAPAGAVAFCAGSSIALNGPAPATGITYQWLLNNSPVAGATANTYTANAAGSYRLVLSNGSCVDTSAPTTVSANALPVATATAAGPLSFCDGGSVVLNAATNTNRSYQWLRNNNVIAGATNTSYTATQSGNYRVRVVNTTTGCADSSIAIAVNVSTQPSATVTQTGISPVCQGATIRFQAATGTGYTYQWYNGGGTIPGATTSSYQAGASGTYYVVIVNGACTTTTTARTIVVNPLPVATVTPSGPVSFCEGGSVQLNGSAAAGTSYTWRKDGGIITGAINAVYTTNQSGGYTLTVTDLLTGCSAISTPPVTVTVSTKPVAVITPQGPTTFCAGNSVNLQANTGAGYTYQWYRGGNPLAGATASVYTAALTGAYTVEVTNGTCVTLSAPIAVTITQAPVAVITPSGPTTFCQGDAVVLRTVNTTGLTYQWTRGGVNIPGATTYSYTASTSGDYNVNLSDGTCPSTGIDVTVTVGTFPVAIITVTGGATMSTDPFASYQWFRNGVAIPGANAQTYTAVRDGYYAVSVTDAIGCSATSAVQYITSLDVEGVNQQNIAVSVWPNPTDGMVHIEAPKAVDIMLLSVDGRTVLSLENARTFDTSPLAQGLYLVRISDHLTKQLIAVQKLNKK